MDNDKYTVQDLVKFSYGQQPIDFETAFDNLVKSRISDAIDVRKQEMSQSLFAGDEAVEDEYDDEDFTDDTDELEDYDSEENDNGESA